MADPPAQAGGYPPGDGGGPWGPPGGAPPPGGGGSYGAPPPPMGPPGGGGYGPPPPPGGGGFGPPGGFGPVGPSFGGPPPPAPSGSKLPLIIGLGCGGLILLSLIGLVVGGAFFARAKMEPPPSSFNDAPPPVIATAPSTGAGSPLGGGATPEIELKDLRSFKGSFGKQRHFVAEIHNTGTVPAGYPSVKVTIVDEGNTAIDSGTCASLIRVLEPGDKVPCTFSLFKAETSTTYKTEIKPLRALYRGELAQLEVTDIKVTPKRGYKPHQITGKITNKSPFKAKLVMALAALYGKDGKIVASDQAVVAGNDLEPEASGLFDAKFYNIAEPADTYRIKAIGYSE